MLENRSRPALILKENLAGPHAQSKSSPSEKTSFHDELDNCEEFEQPILEEGSM